MDREVLIEEMKSQMGYEESPEQCSTCGFSYGLTPQDPLYMDCYLNRAFPMHVKKYGHCKYYETTKYED